MRTELIDCPGGPIAAADLLREGPYTCLLDSSLPGLYGRWSFLGVQPKFVIEFASGRVTVDGVDVGAEPFRVLSELIGQCARPFGADAPPFTCGLMGYLTYDLCRYLERVEGTAIEDLPQPDMCLAFYDCAVAFDLTDGRVWLSYLESGKAKAEDIRRRLKAALPAKDNVAPIYKAGQQIDWSSVQSNFTRDEYLRAIELVKNYIAAGDIYQLNLSQRFSAPAPDGWKLYRTLRSVNPAPFGCYLDFPGLELASSSPERLLSLDGRSRIAETRPIKGTRPRGATPDEDRRLADELAASEKDRAENVMIVDMSRNDLGRVCDYGSVRVSELWAIEEHPNVFQMVSTVQGKLADDKGPADLLSASFPGASITGAPKVRAMQLIDEIEPTRRGIYTGSVGYIDVRGNMDFNIVIRSFLIREGRAYFHGGGGIVADSVPELEYQETVDKVSGLLAALKQDNL